MEKVTHVIEDTANRFWAVWEAGDADLAHVFYGVEVKRAKGGFQPKAKARKTLVRRECTRVVATLN
jgi:hypothetical protein